jgi:hypothetical protein
MEIARQMAGYSLGGADLLRRAMGKKIQEAMDAERPKFLAGAADNGVDEKTAKATWDLLDKFANYGFNKSHAAAYAVVSYQTAWLKANHPVEFMAGVMNCDLHLTDKLAIYFDEVRKGLSLPYIPPCVNRSHARFDVAEGALVYGLGALKNVGVEAMGLITNGRGDRPVWISNVWAKDRLRCSRGLGRLINWTVIGTGSLTVWMILSPIRRQCMSSAIRAKLAFLARPVRICLNRAYLPCPIGCLRCNWQKNLRRLAFTCPVTRWMTICPRSNALGSLRLTS